MSDLVIVESPAKAKTIKKYLGKNYDVVASVGHIRDLPKSKLGVDIEHNFEPQYENKRDKSSLIKELKAEAAKAAVGRRQHSSAAVSSRDRSLLNRSILLASMSFVIL